MQNSAASETAWLLRVATNLAGPSEGEDLAQQTLLAAQEHPPDPSQPRRAWLRVVTRRFALMSRRKRARWDANAWRLQSDHAQDGTDDVVHRARVLDAVKTALDELSASDRDIVVRRYFLEQDTERVAADLGLQPGAVRTRLSRALTRVRDRLDRDFGGREAWAGMLAFGWPPSTPTATGASTGAAWLIGLVAVVGIVGVAVFAGANEEPERPNALAVQQPGPERTTAERKQKPPAPTPRPRAALRKTILAAHAGAPNPDDEPSMPALSSTGAFSDFKQLAADLREATADCIGPADAEPAPTGVMRFRAHFIAEPDVGALIDELEVTDNDVDDAVFVECFEHSIPAFSIPAPRVRYAQDLDIVVDVGRRHIGVHSELIVDDIPAYLDELRGMGAPEELIEAQRERIESSEDHTIRSGWLSPYDEGAMP